jgi:hypothetical protein
MQPNYHYFKNRGIYTMFPYIFSAIKIKLVRIYKPLCQQMLVCQRICPQTTVQFETEI